MSRPWSEDLREMHAKFGVKEAVAKLDLALLQEFVNFRIRFLEEELTELKSAQDAEEKVDALIDLAVVAIGTLDAMGVDAQRAWWEVHVRNMQKKPGANPNRPNRFGLPDLIKPEGWTPPCHTGNVGLFALLQEKKS